MLGEIGKRLVVMLEEGSNSRTIFGVLIHEDPGFIKLEMKDGTIFTLNKTKIISTRPFKEESVSHD